MRYLSLLMLVALVGLASWNLRLQKQIRAVDKRITDTANGLGSAIYEASKKPVTKSEHHYELRQIGARTFRFDPATGDTCIQFTSQQDWKKIETKRQGCEYADAIATIDLSSPTSANEVAVMNCLYLNQGCQKPVSITVDKKEGSR